VSPLNIKGRILFFVAEAPNFGAGGRETLRLGSGRRFRLGREINMGYMSSYAWAELIACTFFAALCALAK
jgi:hypothetical protein